MKCFQKIIRFGRRWLPLVILDNLCKQSLSQRTHLMGWKMHWQLSSYLWSSSSGKFAFSLFFRRRFAWTIYSYLSYSCSSGKFAFSLFFRRIFAWTIFSYLLYSCGGGNFAFSFFCRWIFAWTICFLQQLIQVSHKHKILSVRLQIQLICRMCRRPFWSWAPPSRKRYGDKKIFHYVLKIDFETILDWAIVWRIHDVVGVGYMPFMQVGNFILYICSIFCSKCTLSSKYLQACQEK